MVRLVASLLCGGALAGAGPAGPAEVAAFADPLLAEQMKQHEVPGAVFVVVRGEATLYAKGHGYAELETKRPVDADRTLFYMASVTKLFTATAVLQLAEQGRLDLREDVNRYLRDFQLPATWPEPVTLAHLLTHTGGFDDRNIGYVSLAAAAVLPLGEYLARRMPPRVRPRDG